MSDLVHQVAFVRQERADSGAIVSVKTCSCGLDFYKNDGAEIVRHIKEENDPETRTR